MPWKFCLFFWQEHASRAAMLCMLCVIIPRIYIIRGIQVIVRHANFLKMRDFHVTFLSTIKKFCQIVTVYLNRRKLLLYQQ